MHLMALSSAGRRHPRAGEADGRADGQAAVQISKWFLTETHMPERSRAPFGLIGVDNGLQRGQRGAVAERDKAMRLH